MVIKVDFLLAPSQPSVHKAAVYVMFVKEKGRQSGKVRLCV